MQRIRFTLPVLLALLPVVAWRTGIRCEASGHALGAELGATLNVVERQLAPSVEDPDAIAVAQDDAEVEEASSADRVEVEASPNQRAYAKRKSASRGVFIGGRVVLELAERGVVPAGRWVVARGNRPAGILLSRVSALGVGMVDGDVLTDVEGRPVQTEAQIAALVLAARARHDSNVSAVFWRGGVAWTLIVEMPYPEGSAVSN